MTRATQVTERCTYHGEGPYWDREAGRLLVVDMLAGAIVDVGGGTPVRHEYGGVAAVIRRRAAGGFVLAVEHGYRYLDEHLTPVGEVLEVFDDPAIRMNEGGCDPQGRLYLGTMAYDASEGAGTLYRIDTDRSVHEVLHGVTISNGLQWREDGLVAFYDDTATHRISQYAFDSEAGILTDRTTLVDIPEAAGSPDGLAIDVEGGLWCALFGGSAVHRYDQDGRLTEVVELPVRDVTSCTFGGPDLSTLFITTSRDGWGGCACGAGGGRRLRRRDERAGRRAVLVRRLNRTTVRRQHRAPRSRREVASLHPPQRARRRFAAWTSSSRNWTRSSCAGSDSR